MSVEVELQLLVLDFRRRKGRGGTRYVGKRVGGDDTVGKGMAMRYARRTTKLANVGEGVTTQGIYVHYRPRDPRLKLLKLRLPPPQADAWSSSA